MFYPDPDSGLDITRVHDAVYILVRTHMTLISRVGTMIIIWGLLYDSIQ